MRESVATMTTCDVMVTPDSSLFHVAQALGIPVVGLFGSFPGRSTRHRPIQGSYHSGTRIVRSLLLPRQSADPVPRGRPCSIAKFCTVLAAIPPAQILKGVQMHLGIDPDASNGDLLPIRLSAMLSD